MFYLLDLAQDDPRRLHIAPLYGDNPYFTAFIALNPSEHVCFIEAIYRTCYGDLWYWFMNLYLYPLLLFIFINLLLLILWIYAWFLWFTFFAYKKINLYLCKANEEGRFCGFSKCTWEAGAFFSSALRSQFSLGTLAQEPYRDNIKAGSIKFHF